MSTRDVIEKLNSGGIGIFPTDTAFGIGCRIDREETIKRLFDLRNRPEDKAVPVLVDSIEMAEQYLFPLSENIRALMQKYWPGGVTIIALCQKDKVPFLVRGGGNAIGVRMPNHSTILELIRGVGVPILGPSANFSGKDTPFEFEKLDPELVNLVDFVLPGECIVKQASTVIDCSVNPWKIVREGAVKVDVGSKM